MSEPINAAELNQETQQTLDGTEQVVMFDVDSGKRITVDDLGGYILEGLPDQTVEFESSDAPTPLAYEEEDTLDSGLTLSTLFSRISTMIKNIRYIWGQMTTLKMQSVKRMTETGYNGYQMAFGYITSSGTDINIIVPMCIQENLKTFTITKFVMSLRTSDGGYVMSNGFDALSYISKVTGGPAGLSITLKRSDGWGVTNNTPVSGGISFTIRAT